MYLFDLSYRTAKVYLPVLFKSFKIVFFTLKNTYKDRKMLIISVFWPWCSLQFLLTMGLLNGTCRFEKVQWDFATSLWTTGFLPASLSAGCCHLTLLLNRSPGVHIKGPVRDRRVWCCSETGCTKRQRQGCHFPAWVKWVNLMLLAKRSVWKWGTK